MWNQWWGGIGIVQIPDFGTMTAIKKAMTNAALAQSPSHEEAMKVMKAMEAIKTCTVQEWAGRGWCEETILWEQVWWIGRQQGSPRARCVWPWGSSLRCQRKQLASWRLRLRLSAMASAPIGWHDHPWRLKRRRMFVFNLHVQRCFINMSFGWWY